MLSIRHFGLTTEYWLKKPGNYVLKVIKAALKHELSNAWT